MEASDLNGVVLVAALVLLLGVAAVRLCTRAGLPSLLLCLAIGLILGEVGLGWSVDNHQVTAVLGSLALAVILFESGLTTNGRAVRPVLGLSLVLATVGVAVSVTVTAVLVWLLLDVDGRTAILLGAVVSSTDAAATFAAMRLLPLRRRLRTTLAAESGFNDVPVIIVVTVVTSDAWGRSDVVGVVGAVATQLLVGAAVGCVLGWSGRWVLARSALPVVGLYPLATLAIAMVAFATAGLAGGSPFLAVYLVGLWLAQARLPHRHSTRGFVDGLTWLAQIGLFVLLGLLASPGRLIDAVLPAAVVGLALVLIARPVSVIVCAAPFRIPWREQAFLSWAGLRGGVPIVLATLAMATAMPAAERVFDVVFLLVVAFTMIQAPTLPPVARLLGVDEETARELSLDSAPLEESGTTLLQFTLPERSRLAGVYLAELRLPDGAAVTLIRRRGEMFVPNADTVLASGDHLLIVTAEDREIETERRLRSVSRGGRLAQWRGIEG